MIDKRRGSCLVFLLADEARRGSANSAALSGAHANYMGVNSTGDAVLHLVVDFGENVASDDALVLDIADSSALNDVADVEALDGLVLGHAAAAVIAANSALNPTAVVSSAVIASLDWHVFRG
jgi:hypothetical protein